MASATISVSTSIKGPRPRQSSLCSSTLWSTPLLTARLGPRSSRPPTPDGSMLNGRVADSFAHAGPRKADIR